MAEAIQAALLRLYRGLGQRALMADDPRGRAIVDRKLLPTLDALGRALLPEAPPLTTPPPRRIAVAMAMAVYSQPHLSSTFCLPDGRNEPPLAVEPLVVSNEVLESTLGLSAWELDDLREEVDRRAGTVLKQATLVQWLLSRYEDPSRVFHMLFPGIATRGEPKMVRRGAHLYALVDHPRVPAHALFLPWIRDEAGQGIQPLDAFRGRYVDAGLKRALARGIGASEAEVVDLLERTVALLPADGAEVLLAHDQWRHRGLASVTSVGQPYPKLAWLAREVDAAEVRWQDWIQVDDDGTRVREPLAALEGLARHRLHPALEALQTDVLARRFAQRTGLEVDDDLGRADLGAHVEAVLDPLVRWTRAKGSATWLARATGLRPDGAATLLTRVGDAWADRIRAWARPEADRLPESVLAKWIQTVAALEGALTVLGEREADSRWDHRDLLFLFAAHYMSEAPADRALMTPGVDPACPGLAVARWFWPTWMRLLDGMEQEASTTNPEFVIPDGLF